MTGQSFARDLEFRRIDQLFRQNLTSPVLTVAFTSMFVIVGWNQISHGVLIAWAAFYLISSALRTVLTWRWYRAKARGVVYSIEQLQAWLRAFIAGCLAAGIAAGVLGLLSVNHLDPEKQLVMGFMQLGMCSSSIAVYAVSYVCALSYLLPSMLIWGVAWVLAGASWPMPVLVVVYTLVHILLAKNWSNYANNSLRTALDLHHNREKLRLAMESSGAWSWSWDPLSDKFECDSNFANLDASACPTPRSLQSYLELVHPDDRAVVKAAFLDVLRAGVMDLEHRLAPRGVGLPRVLAVRGRVQVGEGTSANVSGITWDITDKKNEESLRFERDLLEKANNAKLMFLANVSHEMCTPLTAIIGFTQDILEEPGLALRFREKLGIVLRSGRYLTSVVHDLLDLSKAEADAIFIQRTNVNLPEEINDSIHVVRSAIEEKNLQLGVTYESPVPQMILADGTRLRQILINLLSNSVKYTERGRIDLRVSFEETDISGRLRIVVADTGIGITEQDSRNLFQPFTRGDSRQVRQRHGSGLGLALSRTLALRMGGDLRLLWTSPQTETSAGGTVFELVTEVGPCPGAVRLKEHPGTVLPSPRLVAANAATFENRRFLLVEDDEDIRWLLKDYLEKKGASVVTCNHGGEAGTAAFNAHFDAVLMDIKMPVMDGFEATTLLRQQGFRQPIVALTAHANSTDMMKCYQAGCDHYLSKPINFGHLEDVLKRCLTSSFDATS